MFNDNMVSYTFTWLSNDVLIIGAHEKNFSIPGRKWKALRKFMKKYYELREKGKLDAGWVIIDEEIDDFGYHGYKLARGEQVADVFPSDAKLPMSSEFKGKKLGSLLGNVIGWLIVDQDVANVITSCCEDCEIEVLPFELIDSMKIVRSSNYRIINPIGTIDCLNDEKSIIEYFKKPGDPYDGKVISVNKIVLSSKKLEKNRKAIFRIKEDPSTYVVSEDLKKALEKGNFENVLFFDLNTA